MVIPLGAFFCKIARLLHVVVVLSLLLQIILPSTVQVSAASLASAPQAPATALLSQPVNPETQPDPSADELITPTLPIQINVQLDTLLIAPNETTTLTLTLQSEMDTTDLNLVLMLPAAIVTSQGQAGPLQWAIPGLSSGQSYTQVVSIQVNAQQLETDHAAVSIEGIVSAAGYTPATASALLGVAPLSTSSTTNIVEAPQTTAGTALTNNAGDVVLLVEPETAPTDTTFVYTELYDAADTMTATTQASSQQLVTSTIRAEHVSDKTDALPNTNRLFLPLVSGNTEDRQNQTNQLGQQIQASNVSTPTAMGAPSRIGPGWHSYL